MTEQMVIRDAEVGDGEALRNVISEWVRDPVTDEPRVGDIEDIIGAVEASAEGKSDRLYKVATIGGKVVGMVGMKSPEEPMRGLAQTQNPIELINMYLASADRGKGAGRDLVDELVAAARRAGHSEMLVNSGPRYEQTAWGFYDRLFGQRIASLLNYYGESIHAPVWRMLLEAED